MLVAENHFRNRNTTGGELETGTDRQIAYRADVVATVTPSLEAGAGGSVERAAEGRIANDFDTPNGRPFGYDDWSAHAVRGGIYLHAQWHPIRSVTIAPGVRADRSGVTGQSALSPWLQLEWRVGPRTSIKASSGRYVQLTDFDHAFGAAGNPRFGPSVPINSISASSAASDPRCGSPRRSTIAKSATCCASPATTPAWW